MKSKVDCPYCNGSAILIDETREITYKEETLTVKAYFYRCELCREEFTTTETDMQTMMQLHTI